MKAIIVGAGIAGLAAALRLRQAGWEVLVLERAQSRRRGGYALHLFGPGYDTADRIGILPALRARDFGPLDLIRVGVGGRRLFTVPGPAVQTLFGGRNLNLLRSDVEDVLHDEVQGKVEIRYGTTVDAVTQDATAVHVVLNDGSETSADLLIGADGRHSRVRELLFGPERQFSSDIGHMIATFTPERIPSWLPERSIASLMVRGRVLNVLNLAPGRTAAFLAWETSGSADAQQMLIEASRALPGLVPPTGSVSFGTGSQINADRWVKGRVVLLGDAAWLVTPFAARGASLALTGADLLAIALQRNDLAGWELRLRSAVARSQRTGRRRARAVLSANPLRDVPLRALALLPRRQGASHA